MKKVLLGMSGGVDSSVAAILLKDQGFEVYGTTMELYPNSSCCNLETYMDAKKVCSTLGFSHHIIDSKEAFRKYVIEDFIESYRTCETPNPCIECNKYMKFGIMYEKAKEQGIDYVSTGHYAKTEYSEKYKRYVLKKSKNIAKDQTYFLYKIPKEVLEYTVFPLGDFESKDEIRKIAASYGFSVASKKDSEDLCFAPEGSYKEFLYQNNVKGRPGNIINSKGEILGKHEGLINFTIGQRKGLGISYSEPLFVIGFDQIKNNLIVGTKKELYETEFYVRDINLLLFDEIKEPLKVMVKTRYTTNEYPCTIEQVEEDKIKVVLDEPVAGICPGQSAVFYLDDIVVGGGRIIKDK